MLAVVRSPRQALALTALLIYRRSVSIATCLAVTSPVARAVMVRMIRSPMERATRQHHDLPHRIWLRCARPAGLRFVANLRTQTSCARYASRAVAVPNRRASGSEPTCTSMRGKNVPNMIRAFSVELSVTFHPIWLTHRIAFLLTLSLRRTPHGVPPYRGRGLSRAACSRSLPVDLARTYRV